MGYSYSGEAHRRLHESYLDDADPFPAGPAREFPPREYDRDEVGLLQRLLFPRCWNAGAFLEDPDPVRDAIDELGRLFHTGVAAYDGGDPSDTVDGVLGRLPELRSRLKKDVEAAYKGDPAAKSYVEVIRSYPGFTAILVQRVAHELYDADVSEYARELTEYAKTETGIDIHPGAEIGDYFFVDHGTGVVVGETATVGEWTRLYQNVTLGALHFEEQEHEDHMLKKGYKRHPDVGDHVVVGAGSNILGNVSIGDHVSIGSNSWITTDIPDDTVVYVSDHPEQEHKSRHDR